MLAIYDDRHLEAADFRFARSEHAHAEDTSARRRMPTRAHESQVPRAAIKRFERACKIVLQDSNILRLFVTTDINQCIIIRHVLQRSLRWRS